MGDEEEEREREKEEEEEEDERKTEEQIKIEKDIRQMQKAQSEGVIYRIELFNYWARKYAKYAEINPSRKAHYQSKSERFLRYVKSFEAYNERYEKRIQDQINKLDQICSDKCMESFNQRTKKFKAQLQKERNAKLVKYIMRFHKRNESCLKRYKKVLELFQRRLKYTRSSWAKRYYKRYIELFKDRVNQKLALDAFYKSEMKNLMTLSEYERRFGEEELERAMNTLIEEEEKEREEKEDEDEENEDDEEEEREREKEEEEEEDERKTEEQIKIEKDIRQMQKA